MDQRPGELHQTGTALDTRPAAGSPGRTSREEPFVHPGSGSSLSGEAMQEGFSAGIASTLADRQNHDISALQRQVIIARANEGERPALIARSLKVSAVAVQAVLTADRREGAATRRAARAQAKAARQAEKQQRSNPGS